MTRYAANTTVTTEKSRAEIERTLSRHGRHIEFHRCGCWEWTGPTTDKGYARISQSKTSWVLGHRLFFEIFRGKVPDGLDLDHLCRNRNCINPSHLEPVSRRENVMRGRSPFILAHHSGSCVRGHQMTPDNTYISPKGQKHCKACRQMREKKRQDKRKYLHGGVHA